MDTPLQQRIQEAIANPKNLGELPNADAIGTVGSPDCGDMLRMWIKFKDQDGRRVIDRATFQTFGCETAIAVASVATELISGKTAEEALNLSGADLSAPLGGLPPMKIHCAQLVEGALRSALAPGQEPATSPPAPNAPTLFDQLGVGAEKQVKVVLHKKSD
jgi:NifU-like protein involved in Fe-S cluster formation